MALKGLRDIFTSIALSISLSLTMAISLPYFIVFLVGSYFSFRLVALDRVVSTGFSVLNIHGTFIDIFKIKVT